MLTSDKYYTVEEVAKMLKLTRAHVYKLISKGVIKAVKLGRFLRIPADGIPGFQDGDTGGDENVISQKN